MKRVNAAVLAVCLAVLMVLAYSGRQASADPAHDVSDIAQIRGMGTAFTAYAKKYRYFPALMDVSKAKEIATVRAEGNCLAMKLLLAGGFVDDAKLFFSPRNGAIDPDTLTAITQEMDPAKDTTWACAFAYDAGHSPLQGATLFFGSEINWLKTHDDDNAHVLCCNGTVQSLERNAKKDFEISARPHGATASQADNIYADDSAVLKWNDSYLMYDASMTAKKMK